MGRAYWTASRDGRYWLEVALAGHPVRTLLDTGLIDPAHLIGFEIDPQLFDHLKRSSVVTHTYPRGFRDSAGVFRRTEAGETDAVLIDPITRQPIGPGVRIHVSRGKPGVSSRVGVAFFHRLAGCRVVWDLDQRTWSIEYP